MNAPCAAGMISPRPPKSSPIAVPSCVELTGRQQPRAYSDPNIFKNDRVLRTLISREVKQHATTQPTCTNYFTSVQTDVKPAMRREVAGWMLEVCEEENCPPQVFCLAINYLDRFLAITNIRRNQLQLLGAVCLLVSWKVRSHTVISAQKLIEFTDFNVTLEELLEWEFLLLSKLDWDLSAVIAPDFVEHILQRLLKLDLAWNLETTRRNAETLIYLCYSHFGLATYPPSLIAVSSILTTLRPVLEVVVRRDTPSPSSASSASSCSDRSSPAARKTGAEEPLENVIEAVEKLTLVERSLVLECMERLEELMQASLPLSTSSLPPSPSPSDEDASPMSRRPEGSSSSYPQLALMSLFPESDAPEPTGTV